MLGQWPDPRHMGTRAQVAVVTTDEADIPWQVLQVTFDGLFRHWWPTPRLWLQSRHGLNQSFLMYARLRGCSVQMEYGELGTQHPNAMYQRNVELVHHVSHVVAFWDGQCRRVEHLIETTRDLGRPIQVFYTAPLE